MNICIIRWSRFAAAIAFLVLTCGTSSHAWGADANLWVAFASGGGIESYASGQLRKSVMPSPAHLSTFPFVLGLAFDKSQNLWASVDHFEVVRFTRKQLKDLKDDPSPTPGVIITSMSTFNNLIGCNFDKKGNLGVVDVGNDSIDELSKAQLAAGTADITPAIVITLSGLNNPNFVTFDRAGNAWVDDTANNQLAEFSASRLTTGGTKTPAVLLADDGSGTSLSDPGELVFDKKGNLWVPNFSSDTVVEYSKGQLAESGNPAPTVKLNSAIFDGPFGAAFDSESDLVVMNINDGTIAKFTATELKANDVPTPKVAVTGTETNNYQITFGPAS